MNRYLILTFGTVLSLLLLTSAARADDRAQYTACKAEALAAFGEDARVRLFNSRRRGGVTEMRLRVSPAEGEGSNLLCTRAPGEAPVLRTSDGIALEAAGAGDPVAVAGR